MSRLCKAQRNRAAPQDALHRTSALHWWVFQDPHPGEQQRAGPPTVSLDPIWAVQLLSLQARANHKQSPCVDLHSAAVVGFGFNIGRTAPTQQRWDRTLAHPEHTPLAWLLSVQRQENCVSPYACPVNPAQELPHKQEIPAFKGLRAQGWMQCNTDSQNYWGGKAPLRITKPIPCLKQGPSKEAVSRWALMISKKCSITYHISYLWSVITLTTNRGLSSLFFPPHASIHCVQCLYSSGISSGVVID